MITEEGDKGIRELKSHFPEFNLGVRESSVNCHPRQKEVSRDNAGLLSTRTLQLTLSGNEHRKLFKTQRRSQPCSGEEHSPGNPWPSPCSFQIVLCTCPCCPVALSRFCFRMAMAKASSPSFPSTSLKLQIASYPWSSSTQARTSPLFSLTHPQSILCKLFSLSML